MTISDFANQHKTPSWDTHGVPAARAYREHKRQQAAHRDQLYADQLVAGQITLDDDNARRGRQLRERTA